MKKRLLALVSALLAMTLLLTGCSDGGDTEKKNDDEIDLSRGGVMLTLPKEYAEAKGMLYYNADQFGGIDDVYYTVIEYIGMTEDEYTAFATNDNRSDEEIDHFYEVYRQPVVIICAADDISETELTEAFLEAGATGLEDGGLDKLGTNGGYNFYLILDSDRSQDEKLGDYAEEYKALCGRELIAGSVRFVEPVKETFEGSDGKLSFETTDIFGNKVTSSELFGKNKVTVVNIFASWCGPCIGEMPELEALSAELADMDCGVIGILADANEGSGLEDGIAVVQDTGVTYPVIVPWESFDSDLYYNAYPTTYFVDSEGNILAVEPVVGAYVSRYKECVEQALGLMK